MAVKKDANKDLNAHIADLSDYTKKNIILKLRNETLTANAPRNAGELYQACQVLFGVDIPYTACSEENTAPFQLVYDLYFDKIESGKALAMANRGGSKTFYSSMATYLNNTFKPGYACRHAGANRQQAGVASAYLRNFGIDEVLGQVFTEQPAKFGATWKNGSQFAIVTGSIAGVCLSGWSSITTNHGSIPIRDIVDKNLDVEVLSLNTTTRKFEWKRIIGRYNHGTGGEFYKLHTNVRISRGLPSFTLNHEVLLFDGTKKQVGDLVPGDVLMVRDYVLSDDEHQIILGSLLGDGSTTKDGRFSYAHGVNQYYYGDWKFEALFNLQQSQVERVGGFGTTCKWYRFDKTAIFKDLRDSWYPNSKKRVNKADLYKLTSLGLAIWVMDDGSYTGSNLALYTNGFDLEDQNVLADFLESRYGVRPSILQDVKKAYYLNCNKILSDRILTDIAKFMHVENTTKVWHDDVKTENGSFGPYPAIYFGKEASNLKDDTKYDITVEDNHNFVLATGQVVSNSGQHPNSFTMDEIEFWDVEALEQTWAVPVSIGDHRPQWLAYSTRQRAASAMSWLVDNAKQRNVQIYQWTIFETMKRCPSCVCIEGGRVKSDPNSHCLLWERCKGLKGTKSTGWIDREAVIELTKGLGGPNSVASITQLFCEKPTTHGLVLHNFEHEYAPSGNYTRWEYHPELPYVIWFDPSEGKKAVMWFVQIHTNDKGIQTIRMFDELVIPNCASTSSAKRELVKYILDKQYPNPLLIVVDPRRTDAVADLKNKDVCGIEFKAKTAPLDEVAGGNLVRLGCEAVRDAICNGNGKRTLLVNPEMCPSFIEMTRQFAYKVDSNNVITSENPMEVKKDEFDATHYGVDWYNGEGKRVFGSGGSLIQSILL